MAKHLHRDLEDLSKDILTLGGRVEDAINKAIAALVERRPELVQEVIAGDLAIDRQELEVEDKCLKILALHQPVAADLRFVITVLKVNNDLERMGDHAANIAGRAQSLSTHNPIETAGRLQDMAAKVRSMVHDSLDALVSKDTAKARQVVLMDEEVDEAHRQMYPLIQDLMREDPTTIERAIWSLGVSRHLERIADLATNIAQDLVFMVEGEIVRHRGPRI
jgi:phosphate transport system protein